MLGQYKKIAIIKKDIPIEMDSSNNISVNFSFKPKILICYVYNASRKHTIVCSKYNFSKDTAADFEYWIENITNVSFSLVHYMSAGVGVSVKLKEIIAIG